MSKLYGIPLDYSAHSYMQHEQQPHSPSSAPFSSFLSHHQRQNAPRNIGSTYSMMLGPSSLKIDKHDMFETGTSLPREYREVENFPFRYDYRLELDTIAQIQKEREQEEKERRMLEEKRKQAELRAQEEAWKALEEEKKRRSSNPPKSPSSTPTLTPKDTNLDKLIDLDFEEMRKSPSRPHKDIQRYANEYKKIHKDTGNSKFSSTSSSWSVNGEEAVQKLSEMGLNRDLIMMAIDAFGMDNQLKLVDFVTGFEHIYEKNRHFPVNAIKKALIIYEGDWNAALSFVEEYYKLTRQGISEDAIDYGLSLFSNDIQQGGAFAIGYSRLKELGLRDEQIKEALIAANNDNEVAVQYLLENNYL